MKNLEAQTLPPADKTVLARALVDALLERDLLGVLLSNKHFKLAMATLPLEPGLQTTSRDLAINCEAANNLHQWALRLFSGIYIDECKHETKEALMADLDKKCLSLLQLVGESWTAADALPDLNESIDLVWRYRRKCASMAVTCL